MKNILVLVANYPNNNGGVALMYVHTRNKYYIQHDINVTVLNFAAKKSYVIDNINVIALKDYKKSNESYDVLILHASNLRNHYIFLKKYESRFAHIVFFFHGHEVLKLNKTYPKAYDFVSSENILKIGFQDVYDSIKLKVWNGYLPKLSGKSDFIFVSRTFYNEFKNYTGLDDSKLKNHVHVINNSVGKCFEEFSYNAESEKEYDFITVRNMLDKSVYCIDILCELAVCNPKFKFLLIGRGEYFNHRNKPKNVTWIDRYLQHDEMLEYVDKSKCALMLTRRDTQGVMSCEFAAYGIPVITSDIEICREIFGDLENVAMIDNDISKVDLNKVYSNLLENFSIKKSDKFSYKNTVESEEKIIKKI